MPPPPKNTTGLFHLAILYPTRADLAKVLQRMLDHGVELTGASDHGESEALYVKDPDDNGVELYRDRAREALPKGPDGAFTLTTKPLRIAELLAE